MYDLFLLMKDVDIDCYADKNTPYIEGGKLDRVISALQNADASLFEWHSYNQMKANLDKCNLLIKKSCKKEINSKRAVGGSIWRPCGFSKNVKSCVFWLLIIL